MTVSGDAEGKADWLNRTRLLLGTESMQRLACSRVYVFGLGAVGSYATEGLVRSGVGMLRLIDFDVVRESNLNRQLYAMRSNLGRFKADVAAERALDINPDIHVEGMTEFAHADNVSRLLAGDPDVIIDAVDSLGPKVEILAAASLLGVPVFSALGAATRRDAGGVRFGPLFSAKGCPLGRLVRKRLRRRGIDGGNLWCVYSEERRNLSAVSKGQADEHEHERGRVRDVLGSMSTVTGLFGLRLAHEAILGLAGGNAS